MAEKTFGMKTSTCGVIAENTIEYSYFMNAKLVSFLHDVAYVMASFSLNSSERPARVKNFRKIRKQVTACAIAIQGGKGARRCKRYCNHFKLNANSPVIEGYLVFFNDVLNAMMAFIKNYSKKHVGRVLQEEEDDSDLVNFSMDDVKNRPDFYDESLVDPNFDEYVLNEMFNYQ